MTGEQRASARITAKVTSWPVVAGGLPGSRGESRATMTEDVFALMRINYDRVLARHGLPAEAPV